MAQAAADQPVAERLVERLAADLRELFDDAFGRHLETLLAARLGGFDPLLGTRVDLSAAVSALSLWAFAAHRVLLETAAPLLIIALLFVAVTVRWLEMQTWRALSFAIGMRRRDALLKSVVQSSTDCIMCIDESGVIRMANPAASKLFGCAAYDLLDAPIGRFITLLLKVYADFGFSELEYKLSTRPEKRIGTDAQWDKAEKALGDALDRHGLKWQVQPGEGAFYGPKIEFSLRDSIGRVWQCGTLQLDFALPERLGAEYVAEEQRRRAAEADVVRETVATWNRFADEQGSFADEHSTL